MSCELVVYCVSLDSKRLSNIRISMSCDLERLSSSTIMNELKSTILCYDFELSKDHVHVLLRLMYYVHSRLTHTSCHHATHDEVACSRLRVAFQ